jgi:hypothetical protein
MSSLLRSVMAVVVGCLAAFFHIGAIESLNYLIYPPPEGLDMAKPETLAAYMKVIPTGALLVVLLAWMVGTFAGSWITTRLAPVPKRNHGLVIGALFLLAAIGNMSAIPHPLWFWVVSLASFMPMSYLGSYLASPTGKPSPQASDLGDRQP